MMRTATARTCLQTRQPAWLPRGGSTVLRSASGLADCAGRRAWVSFDRPRRAVAKRRLAVRPTVRFRTDDIGSAANKAAAEVVPLGGTRHRSEITHQFG